MPESSTFYLSTRAGSLRQSPQLGRTVQTAAFPQLRRVLRRMHLEGVIKFVSKSPLGDPLRRYLKRSSARRYPAMDPSVRARLTPVA
jgi:hypothetical protein